MMTIIILDFITTRFWLGLAEQAYIGMKFMLNMSPHISDYMPIYRLFLQEYITKHNQYTV